jgi:hypothetical protein
MSPSSFPGIESALEGYVSMYLYLSIYLSIYLSSLYLSMYLSIYLSIIIYSLWLITVGVIQTTQSLAPVSQSPSQTTASGSGREAVKSHKTISIEYSICQNGGSEKVKLVD